MKPRPGSHLCADALFQFIDSFPPRDAFKYHGFLIETLARDQGCNRFADHFFGGVSKKLFRSLVPAGDNAVEIFADDGI